VATAIVVAGCVSCQRLIGLEDSTLDAGSPTGAAPGAAAAGTGGASSAYAEEVLRDEPLAYWRLGDATFPDAVDASGHGRVATYVGDVTLLQAGAVAADGDGAACFGISVAMQAGYVAMGDIFDFAETPEGQPPFSLEAWVKPAGTSNDLQLPIVGTVDYSGYMLMQMDGDRPSIRRFLGTAVDGTDGTTALPFDAYTHLVATFDGQTLRLYVDGEVAGVKAVTFGLPEEPAEFYLAANERMYQAFTGCLDEVAVYGAALPEMRIAAHYAAALP
jgi:hypothetical protein